MYFSSYPTQKEKRSLISKRNILMFLCAFIVLILAAAGLAGSYVHAAIYDPASKSGQTVHFTVAQGEGTRQISEKLERQKLIKSSLVFIGYLKFKDKGAKIQVGDYALKKNMTMLQVIDMLTGGDVITTKITIPEGWTDTQIENELIKKGVTTDAGFKNAISQKYNYSFLKENPAGDLQGFLYPDTYLLSSKPTAKEAITKMLDEFKQKADPVIRAKLSSQSLTYYQILTLASIVEREVQSNTDKKIVAGIFLNRLNSDMPLGSDATIQFILGSNKRIFSDQDIAVDSPYNTYINKGLPPGPIANPSLESIEAVLNPTKTDYFYFFTGKDGKTYFSKTQEEHDALKAKYL